MKDIYNVGLVGYGFASKTFHAPLIAAAKGLELVAVSSSDANKVQADLPATEVVASPQALFARRDIDLVVIPTPNDTHFPLAKAALAAGKHVVVDKPFTLSLREAQLLKSQAEETGKLLSVFHNRRWDSDFRTVAALLEAGTLGRFTHFESHFDRFRPQVKARWREQAKPGGGLWYDLGPHLLDQAYQLFGMPRAILLHLASRRDDAKVDDDFHALLDYDGLRVVLAASSLVAAESPRFVVHGTRGSYVKYGMDPQEEWLKQGLAPSPQWGVDSRDGLLVAPESAEDDAPLVSHGCATLPGDYLAYYTGVYEALRGEGDNPVPADGALAVMQLLEAGMDSARQARWVKLKETVGLRRKY